MTAREVQNKKRFELLVEQLREQLVSMQSAGIHGTASVSIAYHDGVLQTFEIHTGRKFDPEKIACFVNR